MSTKTIAQNSIARIREAQPTLRKLREDLANTIVEIRADVHLSDAGKADRIAQARQAAQQRTEDLITEVEQDSSWVRGWTDTARPQPTPGMEALAVRQVHWRRSEQLLSAGLSPQEVIARTTDLEALHALREELPHWQTVVAATARPGGMASALYDLPDGTQLVRAIDERMTELADGDQREALQLSRELATLTAAFTPMAEHTRQEVAGIAASGSGLASAVASRLASQNA